MSLVQNSLQSPRLQDEELALKELDIRLKKERYLDLLKQKKQERGRRDLWFFNKYVLGYTDLTDKTGFHGELCNYVEDIDKRFVLALMPRGSLKTTCGPIGYALQMMVVDPNIRILLASEEFSLASKILSEIKGHIETNDIFKELYGDISGKVKWNEKEITINTRWVHKKEPTITCAGIDVTKVGNHYDLIFVDDPHSDKNVTTREQIEKVKNWYKQLLSLLDPPRSRPKYLAPPRIVITATRWHYADLSSWIIDLERIREQENKPKRYHILHKRAVMNGKLDEKTKQSQLLWPERLDKDFLIDQLADQGPYVFNCNPGEAPVLMADWTEKPISEVKVGDLVVGWAKDGNMVRKQSLVPSRVLANGSRLGRVFKIRLASGREIRCTRDHNWYLDPVGNYITKYAPAKLGRPLMYFGRLAETKRDKWLAGIWDGEGSSCNSAIRIGQSKKHNPEVCAEIERKLEKHGFRYGSNEDTYWINGGVWERARFLALTRPIRAGMITRTIWNHADFIKERDKVVEIVRDEEEQVYSMQTETGNYIVWGYCSKNCQYQNNPVDDDSAIFKKSWIEFYDPAIDTGEDEFFFSTLDPIRDEDSNDYAAIVTCSMSRDWKAKIREVRRGKWSDHETLDQLIQVWRKWHPKKIGVETVAWQKVYYRFLKQEQIRRGIRIPIMELNTDTRVTKKMRIRSMVPYWKSNFFLVPGKAVSLLKGNMAILVDELLNYPRTANDDCVDALAYMDQLLQRPQIHQMLKRAPRNSFQGIKENSPKSKSKYLGNLNTAVA